MKIYLDKNVLESAVDRIRFLFDEFPEIIVWISGGKDSTVIFHLTRNIAEELGRLPLKVGFIDQESEWQSTIDQIRKIMYRKDVEPLWYQFPFRLSNSTSAFQEWLYCWNPDDEKNWQREKEPISIKENHYNQDRFKLLFEAITDTDFHDKKIANIAGIRAEESPMRTLGLTNSVTYKWITWGKKYKNHNHYSFYPIYDWCFSDVWKYINDNHLDYNKIYDTQFRHGLHNNDMRVSSLHHETSIHALFYMQEAEPETYNKLINRLSGINTTVHFGQDFYIDKLPFMFKTWKEYRDFLLEKLIDPKHQKQMKSWFDKHDTEFEHLPKNLVYHQDYNSICKSHINAILCNDFEGVKIGNVYARCSTKKSRAFRKEMEKELELYGNI